MDLFRSPVHGREQILIARQARLKYVSPDLATPPPVPPKDDELLASFRTGITERAFAQGPQNICHINLQAVPLKDPTSSKEEQLGAHRAAWQESKAEQISFQSPGIDELFDNWELKDNLTISKDQETRTRARDCSRDGARCRSAGRKKPAPLILPRNPMSDAWNVREIEPALPTAIDEAPDSAGLECMVFNAPPQIYMLPRMPPSSTPGRSKYSGHASSKKGRKGDRFGSTRSPSSPAVKPATISCAGVYAKGAKTPARAKEISASKSMPRSFEHTSPTQFSPITARVNTAASPGNTAARPEIVADRGSDSEDTWMEDTEPEDFQSSRRGGIGCAQARDPHSLVFDESAISQRMREWLGSVPKAKVLYQAHSSGLCDRRLIFQSYFQKSNAAP